MTATADSDRTVLQTCPGNDYITSPPPAELILSEQSQQVKAFGELQGGSVTV